MDNMTDAEVEALVESDTSNVDGMLITGSDGTEEEAITAGISITLEWTDIDKRKTACPVRPGNEESRELGKEKRKGGREARGSAEKAGHEQESAKRQEGSPLFFLLLNSLAAAIFGITTFPTS